MSLRYAARTRPGTMVSTWLNSLVSGTASTGAGYIGGGAITGWTKQTTVDKFFFPSDTRTTLGTGLSAATEGPGAMANNGVAGYFAGGST